MTVMSSATSGSFNGYPSGSSNWTLDYFPPVFCKCGNKARLCESHRNGRQFYGCQNWKNCGCGFLGWVDEYPANHGGGSSVAEVTTTVGEIKSIVVEIQSDVAIVKKEQSC